MKRKKFVKVLMGKGLSRNKANLFAKYLSQYCVPYGAVEHICVKRMENKRSEVTFLSSRSYLFEFQCIARKIENRPPVYEDKGLEVGFNAEYWLNAPYNGPSDYLPQQIPGPVEMAQLSPPPRIKADVCASADSGKWWTRKEWGM